MADAVQTPPAEPTTVPIGSLESVSAYREARSKGLTSVPVEAPAVTEPPAESPAEPAPKPDEKADEKLAADAKADQEPDPASEAGKELAKRRTSLQERINKALEKQRLAEQRAEAAERRAAELEAKSRGPEPAKTEPKKPDGPPRPRLADYTAKIGADGGPVDYEDAVVAWKDADDDWKAARSAEASTVEQATRAHEQAVASYLDRLDAFRARTPDFDAVVLDAVTVSPEMEAVILRSEHGPAMVYALAQDPKAQARVRALPVPLQIYELGKLEARITGHADATRVSGPSAVAAPESKAPAPPKPVGSRSTGASTADPSQINSVADWRRRRAEFA